VKRPPAGPDCRIEYRVLQTLVAAHLIAIAEVEAPDLGAEDAGSASSIAEVLLARDRGGFQEDRLGDSIAFVAGFELALKVAAVVVGSPFSIDRDFLTTILDAARRGLTRTAEQG
jgi:hypothetical protein